MPDGQGERLTLHAALAQAWRRLLGCLWTGRLVVRGPSLLSGRTSLGRSLHRGSGGPGPRSESGGSRPGGSPPRAAPERPSLQPRACCAVGGLRVPSCSARLTCGCLVPGSVPALPQHVLQASRHLLLVPWCGRKAARGQKPEGRETACGRVARKARRHLDSAWAQRSGCQPVWGLV